MRKGREDSEMEAKQGRRGSKSDPVVDAINAIGVWRLSRQFGCTRGRIQRWKRLRSMASATYAEVVFVAGKSNTPIAALIQIPRNPEHHAPVAKAGPA